MNKSIIVNREIRQYTLLLSFSILLAMVIVSVCFIQLFQAIHQEWNNRNIAIIGNIIQQHPDLEREIVPFYTKGMSKKDYEVGIRATVKYGLTSEDPLFSNLFLHNRFNQAMTWAIIIILCFFGVTTFLAFRVFRYIYRRINEVTAEAEKIMDGDFRTNLNASQEGDIPKLNFQFNQMANRLEQTLERLEKDKERLKRFFSDISHQLKTPLSSSLLFHDLLKGDDLDNETRETFIDKSKSQLERMQWLIQTLLNMSKVEFGNMDFEYQNRNMMESIEDVILSLQSKANLRGIHLELEGFENEIFFNHDVRWLSEAIRNIVDNAIDYNREDGFVKIQARQTNKIIQINIIDNGYGMEKTDIPHIFERFYQGKKPSHFAKHGTGLGLSFAKIIIEQHRGHIEVNSKINEGTVFTLTFPKNEKMTKL